MSILPSEESVLSATARVFSFTAGISSEDSVSLSIVSESCNARVSSSKASALSIARVFLFHRKNFVWINCIFDHSGWLINARVSSSKANALSIARVSSFTVRTLSFKENVWSSWILRLFFHRYNLVLRRKCRCPHRNSRRTMLKIFKRIEYLLVLDGNASLPVMIECLKK